MRNYVIRRLLLTLLTLWSVLTIIFIVLRVLPGDPALVIAGEHATAETIARLRERMGLNQPLLLQYLTFLKELATANLGQSVHTGQSVLEQVRSVLPHTVSLAVASMVVGSLIGIPLGIVSAVHRGRPIDFVCRIVALTGLSTPAFYLGILLMLVFAVKLRWFPVMSRPDGPLLSQLQHLILPGLSLGLIQASFVTRMTRAAILEMLREDYVRTARSKGLAEPRVLYSHVLRNSLIPIVTVIGLYTGTLLGGAVLTEIVFNRPGLGKLLVGAILQRDYPVIQGGLAVFTAMVALVNLTIDLLYGILDPRIRYS